MVLGHLRFLTPDREAAVIRPASPKDARDFMETMDQVCREGIYLLHERAPRTAAEQEKIIRTLDRSRNLIAVAELDGIIVGGMGIFAGGMTLKAQGFCNLGIHIIKRARGKGIGGNMLDYGIEWARLAGYRKICLSVFADNSRAIGLYSSKGFVVEGRRREQYIINGKYVDELLMARFL